jgi:hypothetical protein
MTTTDLQEIANTVIRKAQHQGYVLPREIRKELTEAGAPNTMWKDILALARSSLSYRKGRYYYVPAVSERVRQEQDQQRLIRRTVEQIITQYESYTSRIERREQQRINFVQLVKAQAEDGREFTLLSRDLSVSGIRLIGTRSLLGQKIHLRIPRPDGSGFYRFLVRILWTCAVSEDFYENGGMFVEAEEGNRD